MMWMVSVQGIEIPVRAKSRAALVGRLEETLGELMARVSVSSAPVPDRDHLLATGDIRYFPAEISTFLN